MKRDDQEQFLKYFKLILGVRFVSQKFYGDQEYFDHQIRFT